MVLPNEKGFLLKTSLVAFGEEQCPKTVTFGEDTRHRLRFSIDGGFQAMEPRKTRKLRSTNWMKLKDSAEAEFLKMYNFIVNCLSFALFTIWRFQLRMNSATRTAKRRAEVGLHSVRLVLAHSVLVRDKLKRRLNI